MLVARPVGGFDQVSTTRSLAAAALEDSAEWADEELTDGLRVGSEMEWVALGSAATALGSAATAAAVVYTKRQLKAGHDQARTAFEDNLEREYRQIAADIPVRALLGAKLASPLSDEVLRVFYRYIDLTNQQVFLRRQGRITSETWHNWCEGIAHHFGRPAFRDAWEQIRDKATEDFEDFSELHRLQQSDFKDDPADWSGSPKANSRSRTDAPATITRVA